MGVGVVGTEPNGLRKICLRFEVMFSLKRRHARLKLGAGQVRRGVLRPEHPGGGQ